MQLKAILGGEDMTEGINTYSSGTDSNLCRFCTREGEKGIRVWGVYMCGSCEEDLLRAPVGGERYMFFLEIFKEAKQSYTFIPGDEC